MEDHLYFHCALAGKKLASLRKDNRACFNVVDVGPQALLGPKCGITQIYKSVLCFGTVEIITDGESKKAILTKMVEKYVPQKYNYSVEQDGFLAHTAVLKMRITNMSGKENKLTAAHTLIERP